MERITDKKVWSLCSSLMAGAMKRFGQKVPDRPIIGLEYNGEVPECFHDGPKNLVIRLGTSTKGHPQQLKFQLAHEVVHAVCRGQKTTAPMIEEGAAIQFSFVPDRFGGDYLEKTIRQVKPQYLVAADLYQQLMELAPDAVKLIRKRNPILDELTAAGLKEVFPEISDGLQSGLLLPLCRWQEAIDNGWANLASGEAALRKWSNL
mgnify:CR=1 FL=1